MSSAPPTPPAPFPGKEVKDLKPDLSDTHGLTDAASLDDQVEKKVDEIEMLGEEEAAGLSGPTGPSEVTPGMRYLHCSRTIHQLVTDRNRAVGIYLAVASLLWTASSALLNIKPENLPHLIVPIQTIQRWCLPATFGALMVLALFIAFLLIRTRIGLIYEVAKMNVLLRLPIGRVQRINPLSVFFILQALVSLGGGASAALFLFFVLVAAGYPSSWVTLAWSAAVGVVITGLLLVLYIVTVLHTTADKKLQSVQ
jgi:hypothetical protein